ncbi:MAG: 2-hydroxyacyl-CoA dehydratase family protein [Peptococcaceae bacterium]|jgi:benzoyl-CoA reductase/2-hydroxyglutaryl-CoA dehydratase subunit BcrC/BadD/HgdB|nr:2-hydroxyacyl-CoA dehydratase family protein [Peptococcaceae bacterium]
MRATEPASDPVAVLLAAAASGSSAWPDLYPGRRAFGYFCSYWPEELVLSLGWEPLRILPIAKRAVPGRLPAYCCFPARSCLAAAEAGEYDFLIGAGFTHTCDTMQSLAGIWHHRDTFQLVPPVTLQGPGADAYCTVEMRNLWHRLAARAGREADPRELRKAISLMNRVRSLALRLDEMRPGLPSSLVAAVLRAGQLMPRAVFAAALEAAWPELEAGVDDGEGRHRLLISGSVLEEDGLYTMVEELGARVVADDTCSGYRSFDGLVDEEKEPVAALVRRLSVRASCPCRHSSLNARPDYLSELARLRGARAAVLVMRKYCDPHAWDATIVSEKLRSSGVSVLILELETGTAGAQEKVRLEAFLECLSDLDQEGQ